MKSAARKVFVALAALGLAALALADFDSPRWPLRQSVEIPSGAGGLCAVPLDEEYFDALGEYPASASFFRDIRVIEAPGFREIPRAVERPRPRAEREIPARPYNRSAGARGEAVVYFDLGDAPPAHGALSVASEGGNFRRRAVVEGSEDGKEWRMLREDGLLLSYDSPVRIREEKITYPESRFRHLRLAVFRDELADEKTPVVSGARVLRAEADAPEERRVEYRERFRREDSSRTGGRVTVVELESRARNVPLARLNLRVEDASFAREVRVSGTNLPPGNPGADAAAWTRAGGGVIYAYDHPPRARRTDVPVKTGYARLRVEILNGDNPPLRVTAVEALAAFPTVYFETKPEKRYFLYYGHARAASAAYDFEERLARMDKSAAVPARLGPQEKNPDWKEPAPPRTPTWEKPAILWSALLVGMLVLGFLIWRAFKAMDPP